ncbi:MAG: glycosyltransferase family 2 protein [Lachnospiraceae bacterium]|nr:glycosyltransferase family 2 protein [Lachnospiraceae bacterium]
MIEGHFSVTGLLVTGWITGTDPLWLELLANDEPVSITQADLPHPQGLGFILPFPPLLLEEGCTLRVRKANTQEYVDKPLSLAQDIPPEERNSRNPTSLLHGELFLDRGLALSGWVIHSENPAAIVALEVRENGTVLARTEAGARRFRPKVSDGHGFLLTLPERLADGLTHTLAIVDTHGNPHPQSPVQICLTATHLDQWLTHRKHLSKDDKAFLAHILSRLEIYNPGCLIDATAWQKAFPPAAAHVKEKYRLCLVQADPLDNSLHSLSPKSCQAILSKQQGISFTIREQEADYVLLLKPGERLQPQALSLLIATQKASGRPLVYADGADLHDPTQLRLKPAFDLNYFAGYDYLGPLLVTWELFARCHTAKTMEALRVELVCAAQDTGGIAHLPEVLSLEEPKSLESLRRQALETALHRRNPNITIEAGTKKPLLRVRYRLEQAPPLVSLIIPTRDHASLLARCLSSLALTSWHNYEVLIVDNDSREEASLALLKEAADREDVRILSYPGPFNYAAINNFAVARARGDVICFLNNDTEILEPDWLSEMLTLLLAQSSVGCVGAKLLWPNDLVQHAGVVIGPYQLASHIGNHWLDEDDGYMYSNQLVREVSCVTAACLLTRKELFTRLGGFDSRRFPVAFNDVDFCLRVRQCGLRILWTPYARLRHHESASRGRDTEPMNKARAEREMQFFKTLWGTYEDPFYNPNLPLSTVTEPYFGLALPPRNRQYR